MGRGNRAPKHRPSIAHDPFCVSIVARERSIELLNTVSTFEGFDGMAHCGSKVWPICNYALAVRKYPVGADSPIADSQQCARDSALNLGASSICGMQIWTCLDFGIGATVGVPPEKSEKQSQMTCGMPPQTPPSSPDVYFYLGAGPRRIWWITPLQSPGLPIQAVP